MSDEARRQLADRAWAYYQGDDELTICDHSNRLAFLAGYNAARLEAIEECRRIVATTATFTVDNREYVSMPKVLDRLYQLLTSEAAK